MRDLCRLSLELRLRPKLVRSVPNDSIVRSASLICTCSGKCSKAFNVKI